MVVEQLQGNTSYIGKLSGELTPKATLSGQLDLVQASNPYTGKYRVTPKAWEEQVLETSNRTLSRNIVVEKVPYWETSNEDGLTAYIAEEL